jgi:hypothetical protein
MLILYIIFLQECNEKKKGIKNDMAIDTVFSRTIDSIYVLDTIYLTSSTVHYDTVFINNDTIGRYTNEVEDELLSGEIISYIDGVLLNQEFNYVAKFPKYIYTIDTLRITTTKPYTNWYLGGELGGNSGQFNISPIIGVINKKGNGYYYRYGLIDKTHNIGISRTLYKY